MIWALAVVAILILVFGPTLWVRYVMRAYSTEIDGMPGTGGELAQHLVERYGLDVEVEATELPDHYDPADRCVRLGKSNFEGKSLTAVAIAAHEVGHAMQHHANDVRLSLRTRLVPAANMIGRIGMALIWMAPVIGLITRHPVPFRVLVFAGLAGLVSRMAVHLVTLPIEWDASFGKALPVLRQGEYIAPGEEAIVRRILKAAALTYVAAALADILNLARWASILLRR